MEHVFMAFTHGHDIIFFLFCYTNPSLFCVYAYSVLLVFVGNLVMHCVLWCIYADLLGVG